MKAFLVTVSCPHTASLLLEALLAAPTPADALYELEGPVEAGGNVWEGADATDVGFPTDDAEKMLELHGYVTSVVDVSRYPATLAEIGLAGQEPDVVEPRL